MSDTATTAPPQPGGPHTRPNEPAEGSEWPGQVPTGPPIAPGAPLPQVPATGLPPGVHPNDPAGTAGDIFTEAQETRTPPKQTAKPYATENAYAFAVNQRAAHDFRAGLAGVNPNNGGVASVVGRRPGRRSLTLWIPSQVVVGGVVTVPANGVMIGQNEGELQSGGGVFLGVGDSMTIESESSVLVGLVPGTTVGYVQYLDLYDEPGGGIAGNS